MPLRKCDLSRLLEDSYEACYWLGFLFADGHFSKKNRLKVVLSEKDRLHLEKLKSFLSISSCMRQYVLANKVYYEISAMDTKVFKILAEKFNTSSNKTKEPCDISKLSEDKLFCLSVGFIDGDGSITKVHKRLHPQLTVKCHANWLGNLRLMYPYASTRLDSRGYAKSVITDSEVLKNIKTRAIEYNLPILQRKWDNIDLSFTSRNQRTKDNLPIIKDLLIKGFSQKEICLLCGYSPSGLSLLIKRKRLKHSHIKDNT